MRLRLIISVCLVVVASWPVPRQPARPHRVTEGYASAAAEWSGLPDIKTYGESVVWNAAMAENTTTTTVRVQPEGNTRAQQEQEFEGDIPAAIRAVFGTEVAVRVARCESRFDPHATNGEHRGLFQIGVVTHAARIEAMGYSADDMWSVGPNLAVAYAIYSEQGWRPWECHG